MEAQAIILRAPARAAQTIAEFDSLGITSWCSQLIDTVWPEDLDQLDDKLAKLTHGHYQWLVLTSVTTVAVLAQRLAGRRLSAHTKVAVVGQKTGQALRSLLGRDPDFQPCEQSARGMVNEWQLPAHTPVLYPHGDLASPTLSEGLLGWAVQLEEVIAYCTVDAGSGRSPVIMPDEPANVRSLAPEALPGLLEHTDLLVFAAPSIVRRFVQLAGSQLPARCRSIAIGLPTARAIEEAGMRLDAISADPTPRSLARCAQDLLKIPTEPA